MPDTAPSVIKPTHFYPQNNFIFFKNISTHFKIFSAVVLVGDDLQSNIFSYMESLNSVRTKANKFIWSATSVLSSISSENMKFTSELKSLFSRQITHFIDSSSYSSICKSDYTYSFYIFVSNKVLDIIFAEDKISSSPTVWAALCFAINKSNW